MRSGDSPRGLGDGAFPVFGAGGRMGSVGAVNTRPGQLLIGRVGTVGSVRLLHEPAWATDNTVVVTPIGVDERWLAYCLMGARLGHDIVGSTAQPLITGSDIKRVQVASVSVAQQRRIADFLDDRVARIDQIITARQQQIRKLDALAARLSYEAVVGAHEVDRRPSALTWTPTVPVDWPVLTVESQFEVELGKMLDESRQTGDHPVRYLRNTNVQWDVIEVDDLKSMDIAPHEFDRYSVKAGDLLICEGGQPGRAALWDGRIEEMGFQKALHRARTRGRSAPEWLLECLRVCVDLNVFAVENGQSTIGHLTNEQLRATRFPFPERAEQLRLMHGLSVSRRAVSAARDTSEMSIARLTEYKQSLITAAVTGEFDVTTASTRIPGEQA
ncbi:restriction endonuclease subunit S [Dermacoccus nishinomiyaensis]|uniref:restriction endonuclease subunit S n=1 Tax=Dermacoccus nishinomiyaensis TaxID=1274 RepID=UPI0030CE84AC